MRLDSVNSIQFCSIRARIFDALMRARACNDPCVRASCEFTRLSS